MPQPLEIMQIMATALTQCVTRTIQGCTRAAPPDRAVVTCGARSTVRAYPAWAELPGLHRRRESVLADVDGGGRDGPVPGALPVHDHFRARLQGRPVRWLEGHHGNVVGDQHLLFLVAVF